MNFALLRHLPTSVLFSFLYRIVQTAMGFLTIPVIVAFLDANQQGYYYTFLGLSALQSFLELGFGIVIMIFSAHEWRDLSLTRDGIVGPAEPLSRLSSLGKIIFRYFSISAGIFFAFAITVGYFTLASKSGPFPVEKFVQFALYLSLTAAVFWVNPVLNIIEGCNQVSETARFRTCQLIVAYGAMWGALASGAGLWSLAVLAGCQFVAVLIYLTTFKRQFLRLFRMPKGEAEISWLNDVFPMQWRIGVQGLFSYFSFPFYTTLAFWALGSVAAGQLGLTLQIASGIQSLGLVAISARGAEFALLAASGKRDELTRKCKAATGLGLTVVMLGFAAFVAATWFVKAYFPHIGQRTLGLDATILLAFGVLATVPVQGIALYLRANKVELLTPIGVSSGILYGVLGAGGIFLWGQIGLVASYALVTALFTLPLTLLIAVRQNEKYARDAA